MKVYIFLFSFISVTCLGQGAMLGTDDDLLVAEGSTFKVISSIGEIPFDYVEGETFGVFVSRYNFNIGRMSTSIEFVSPEIAELKVYPNPFVEKVHIQAEGLGNEPVRIMLVNLEGKLEYQHEISDAGDLLVPVDATSDSPISLCEGENLSAFTANYDLSDEFEQDEVGFMFEYAFIFGEYQKW